MFAILVLAAALASLAQASPAPKSTVVQKLDAAPQGWTKHAGIVDKSTASLKLRMHLVQPRMTEFHDLAAKIATPGDALYGQHLSKRDLDEMLAPRAESSAMVRDWLAGEGLEPRLSGDSVTIEAPVGQIEKLLKTEYTPYSDDHGNVVMRTLEYSLPEALTSHIDLVQPTTFFGLRSLRTGATAHPPVVSASAIDCSAAITPACLASMYSYGSARGYANGRMGIAGFLEEHPSPTDLIQFLASFATQGNKDEGFVCTLISNGTCPAQDAGVEANLDVQYARAITQRVPNVYYSTGGRPPMLNGATDNEPYLEFLDFLLAQPDAELPNTLSISYGDDEDSVPRDYATHACDLFAKLGARGVSVLVASGDSGVGESCGSRFKTAFPAACPWVTTVGGTTGRPELAWTGSGGGFSDLFARPAYQASAVEGWLATDRTHDANAQRFNASGRAYPDVAAAATNYLIVRQGANISVDGTSAACPTFAAVVQLLNSDRLAAGKRPLGFLNPWIYSRAREALNDIQTGGNLGCPTIPGAGFQAVAGWDPATGFGTPNFDALLKIAQST